MEDDAAVHPDSSHPSCDHDSSRPSHPRSAEESDADEEFHSASEGEEEEDDMDDKKLEEWAESLSDLSSDVNNQLAIDTTFTGRKTELCSSEKITKGVSALDVDSGINVSTSSETSSEEKMTGSGEQSPNSKSNPAMDYQEDRSEVASSESRQSSVPEGGKTSAEDAQETERAIAAATGGTENEESGNEGEGDQQEKAGDDCEKGDSEEKRNKKEEEERERKRQEEEDALTEEELQKRLSEAVKVKTRGNDTFKSGQYSEALELYTQALDICPLKYIHQRALILSNRGACNIRAGDYEKVIEDCSKAVDLDPVYIKAYFRRADAYEKLEKLDEALKDHQKVVQLDRSQATSFQACVRLENEIQERNEKLKTEMMGKLKDLGNMVLRPFGLSTNNFQLQQDPSTGSYSVQFLQTPPSNGH